MTPSPCNTKTNFSTADFSSQSNSPKLTPQTTSVTHTAENSGGDKPDSPNNSHNNALCMPTTGLEVEVTSNDQNGAHNLDLVAFTFSHSSFDADSSLHGRFQAASHQHPNPYSRIGCYTVKAQQLIDDFDQRFDLSPDRNSALDKPV